MNIRLLLVVLVLVGMAGITVWIDNASQVDIEATDTTEKKRHVPDYYMDNFEVTTMNVEGKPQSLLQSVKMKHFPDDDSTELAMPVMTLYRASGNPWVIRSERGWITANNELILLSGKVRIERTSGPQNRPVTLYTDRLRIHPDTEFAETDRPVTLLSDTRRTDAIGMRAYVQEGRIQLLNDVQVSYEN